MRESVGRILAISSLALSPALCSAAEKPQELQVFPSAVRLEGPEASHGLVVVSVDAAGRSRDATDSARIRSSNPAIFVVDATGRLAPRGDGKAEAIVSIDGVESRVSVEVRGASLPRVVSFRREIEPVLTKLGCNQGACHGSQHGKGGFKLSLLGFEPEPDHAAIVKSAEGRRVTPFAPAESLLLLKPTLRVGHGGGKKLEPDSDEHRLIELWLAQGAPGPSANEPEVTRLSVHPPRRRLEPGETQRLVVTAEFTDGATRDVTSTTKFDTLGEAVATVDSAGRVRILGAGETNILARHRGRAAMSLFTVPYGPERRFEWNLSNPIDRLAAAKWRELGLAPSEPCTDTEFLRRAMLDAIGTLPTPQEIEAFLADRSPDKRTKIVDAILDRPEYVDYWTLKWGDLLRIERQKLGMPGMLAFNLWLRESFRDNRRFDRMIEELVTAQGSIYSRGPANYFRVASSPDDLAETTAQVFMGVRLQCAKCHHHPFESYGQDDYYGLAAYFARIRTKNSQEFGLFGREQVIYTAKTGEVRQPRSGKVMAPKPLSAEPSDDPVDRRRALARWLTDPKNPWTARSVANRYWGAFFSSGLVNPIDDLRETNPPSNPALLDALADSFIASGFDLKALMRLIMSSRVYQLSSIPTPENRLDRRWFTHYLPRRLGAEVLLDAVNAATDSTEDFKLRPDGTRAISLPDPEYKSTFLDTFGRPVRAIACECERGTEPNLAQALALMNSEEINAKLAAPKGRVARLAGDRTIDDQQLIRTLYLLTFSRPPDPEEIEVATKAIRAAPDRAQGAQDLLWGLLNSKEFLFNH
ncbi:MAG: DUF1553 domain-containing protein [Isosphaeraceae bacterium]|nr:DUF1553 domain-containing protein [Isosphaeraceae bacterium]